MILDQRQTGPDNILQALTEENNVTFCIHFGNLS